MAVAARALRLVSENEATYEARPAKPTFWRARSGLFTAEHARRMGMAIWLYGWLHTQADFRYGIVKHYQHPAAAQALGTSERTVRLWLRQLVTEGYVTAKRRPRDLEIHITNYHGDRQDLADQSEVIGKILQSDRQDLAGRSATSCRSIDHQEGSRNNQEGGTTTTASPVERDIVLTLRKLGRKKGYPFEPYQALKHVREWTTRFPDVDLGFSLTKLLESKKVLSDPLVDVLNWLEREQRWATERRAAEPVGPGGEERAPDWLKELWAEQRRQAGEGRA